jgi:hypothetical protein
MYMYSITGNIYYSQLSSVAILLQPEPVSHRIVQRKYWVLSPHTLSPCGLPLPPTCLLITVNEARSYFASTTVQLTFQKNTLPPSSGMKRLLGSVANQSREMRMTWPGSWVPMERIWKEDRNSIQTVHPQQPHPSPEDGGRTFFRNIDINPQVCVALQPRRPMSTSFPMYFSSALKREAICFSETLVLPMSLHGA